ncbi:MAG: hypothetical protein J6S61_02570, partial [Elusimicrobiaceae bacterium]|nr:hypothetical protein [Elusimicrobiaceae bacterium]
SNASKFFAEHLPEMLKHIGTFAQNLQLMAEIKEPLEANYPDIYQKLSDTINERSVFIKPEGDEFAALLENTLLTAPSSPQAAFYLQYTQKMFDRKVHYNMPETYRNLALKCLPALKDTHPEICEQISSEVACLYTLSGDYNYGDWLRDNLTDKWAKYRTDLYELYPSEGLRAQIEKDISTLKMVDDEPKKGQDRRREAVTSNEFMFLYEAFDRTKLPCLEKIVDKYIETHKADMYISGEHKRGDVDYEHLYEKLQKANLEKLVLSGFRGYETAGDYLKGFINNQANLRELEIRESLLDLQPSYFANMPNLEKIELNGLIQNPVQFLKEHPKLNNFTQHFNPDYAEPDNALFEYLMAEKSKSLTYIDAPFSKEQQIALLRKYPDFLISWHRDESGELQDLRDRNSAVRRAKEAENPLPEAIQNKVVVELLSVMPDDKIPTLADFEKPITIKDKQYNNCFFAMQLLYGKEMYDEILPEIAPIIDKSGKMERQIELNKNVYFVLSYIESLSLSERPSVQELVEPQAFNNDKNFFDVLKRIYTNEDEYKQTVFDVLNLLDVKKEDAKLLAASENTAEAIKTMARKEQSAKSAAASKQAFELWKQQHGHSK